MVVVGGGADDSMMGGGGGGGGGGGSDTVLKPQDCCGGVEAGSEGARKIGSGSETGAESEVRWSVLSINGNKGREGVRVWDVNVISERPHVRLGVSELFVAGEGSTVPWSSGIAMLTLLNLQLWEVGRENGLIEPSKFDDDDNDDDDDDNVAIGAGKETETKSEDEEDEGSDEEESALVCWAKIGRTWSSSIGYM